MKPLFKNKTSLSEENYCNLLEFHQKKNNWKYWLFTAIISICLIMLISFQIANHYYFHAFIVFICFVLFLVYNFIYPYFKTEKELKSDKIKNNLVNYYFFYDKYFTIKNNLENIKIKYYKLYKVYEHENYFFLYINKNYVFIIEKSGFTIGNADSFEKFMKSKLWFKFKKD